ncbi:MAG: HEAT repeat domain-containing protein [Geobacter sp.]|nr:HEAT repeat domain-containing protein [Geobacter sp.]
MKEKVRKRINILRALLKDTAPGVRNAAAQAIEKLEGISSFEEILQALKTGDTGIRVGAIYALGEIGGEKVLPPVLYCATRPEVDIRSAAVEVLGNLRIPAAVPMLVERLDDQHEAVQARAICALRSYPASSEILQKLRTFLEAGNGSLEAEAAITLACLNDFISLDSICNLLSSNHASTRQAAATAISLMPFQ